MHIVCVDTMCAWRSGLLAALLSVHAVSPDKIAAEASSTERATGTIVEPVQQQQQQQQQQLLKKFDATTRDLACSPPLIKTISPTVGFFFCIPPLPLQNKKRDFRRLWIERINAGVRQHGMPYSVFVNEAKKADVELNRKVRSRLQKRGVCACVLILLWAQQKCQPPATAVQIARQFCALLVSGPGRSVFSRLAARAGFFFGRDQTPR